MANIETSMKLLADLEHSNREDKVLHKNKHENGLTYWGIYESMHPSWKGWGAVKSCISFYPNNIKAASSVLYQTGWVYGLVIDFYKKEFWDKMKLDHVKSQKIADELFCFGVNIHWKNAARKVQKLVGAKADGFIGNETLKLINDYDEDMFDIEFDEIEKEYYDDIIEAKPYLSINKQGWYNRAEAV